MRAETSLTYCIEIQVKRSRVYVETSLTTPISIDEKEAAADLELKGPDGIKTI